MGDRSNPPILFGPEWLRNLPRERGLSNNAGQQSGNNTNNPSNQPTGPGPSGTSGTSTGPGTRRNGSSGESAAGSQHHNQNIQPSNGSSVGVRVQLANLRYGREEMLALYEAAAEPPQELKNFELLYQPRGKLPFALSTSFEDEMRESLRSGAHGGGIPPNDRFNMGRGNLGRGVSPSSDNVNRPRFRATVLNRSPTASSGEPQGEASNRPQLNPRARYQPNEHKGFYLSYTGANVMFRSKRQNNTSNSNWRSSQTRDSGEEWRNAESTRSRSGQERDRERPGDRPQAGNRRSLSDHNDESMPEWAFANAEPCAGTFDASGAFHGYSNDDSNLPKTSDGGYSLARSRTHNTLSRSKTVEEGSEEWWASEKAKKLSPKRFDAGDIKFKQGTSILDGPIKSMSQNPKSSLNKEDYEEQQKESPSESPEPEDRNTEQEYDIISEHQSYKQQFSENNPYDAMMRQEMNVEEQTNEAGNFKSVMINTNNALRQKHQNIVAASMSDNQIPINRSHPVMLKYQNQNQPIEKDHSKHQTLEENIIDRFLDMTLESNDISNSGLMGHSNAGVPSAMSNAVNSLPQIPTQGMQLGMQVSNHGGPGLSLLNAQGLSTLNLQPPNHNMPQGLPSVGMNNPSLVLPPQMEFGPNSAMGLPMPGMPQGVLPNAGLSNHGLGGSSLQNAAANLPSFPMPGMSNNNTANTSLLFGKNLSNSSMPQTGDIPMPPNHNAQASNIFPIHGLQHSSSQNTFGNSIFNNLLQSQPGSNQSNNLADQWYYEDPEKNTQGPFTPREMYTWYRAGFFTPSLMVRRACETQMRPLGSYGPLVPFAQLDVVPQYPMSGFDNRAPINPSGLGPNVMNFPNISEPTSYMKPLPIALQNQLQISLHNPMHIPIPNNQLQHQMHKQMHSPMINPRLNAMHTSLQNTMPFGTFGIPRNPPLGQPQNMFDTLWGQPPQDVMWMQRNPPIENRVNNLPMYFWDQQASNSLLPEDIAKEMKTEDQILAQLRASQSMSSQTNTGVGIQAKASSSADQNILTASRPQDDTFASAISSPYFEALQKMIQKEILSTPSKEPSVEDRETQPILQEKTLVKNDQPAPEQNNAKLQAVPATATTKPEPKVAKQTKPDTEKAAKNKENTSTKNKNKKAKEEKKDEVESKVKEEDSNKTELKRSEETSPVKNKKEDKINKKELEKEKKEWLKEGFTIVKGAEKQSKDSKKKSEEAKASEDAEKKRKEEERSLNDEEKKRKNADIVKKHQEQQQLQQQRQMSESLMKKAPWSPHAFQATNKEGLTLTEIQRLEREKKLEQMKEQQQMMAILAQQQAAALAREQEMQANLAWAKKKNMIPAVASQSLTEIQAETRKQASAAAAAAAAAVVQVVEDERPPVMNLPWGHAHNGVGFWDGPGGAAASAIAPPRSDKPAQEVKSEPQPKLKKKAAVVVTAPPKKEPSPAKKDSSPAAEFETWCTTSLKSWSSKIDVPTFIGFLKDIESPYEVKDYVKYYLGETKDSSDFARQFLERRSKLLRVGMVTPSDDLCSPAIAINPRTNSGSDYQEVKGKGKKTKKNKMLKVDARILGFSVTAAEDRINVGDIDTA